MNMDSLICSTSLISMTHLIWKGLHIRIWWHVISNKKVFFWKLERGRFGFEYSFASGMPGENNPWSSGRLRSIWKQFEADESPQNYLSWCHFQKVLCLTHTENINCLAIVYVYMHKKNNLGPESCEGFNAKKENIYFSFSLFLFQKSQRA